MLARLRQWFRLNVLNAMAFSILGLLFVTKPSTLVPSVLLLLFSLNVLLSPTLRAQFIKLFNSSEYMGIARAMLLWFGTLLVLAFIHNDTEHFYFPDNALRMVMALTVLLMVFTTEAKEWFFRGLAAAGIVLMCWASYNFYLAPTLRAQGLMNHPIYFGNLSAVVMMIALSVFLLDENLNPRQRLLMVAAAVGGAFGMTASMSRSSIFVLLCLLPLVVAIQSKLIRRRVCTIMVVLSIALTLGLAKSSTLQDKLRISEGITDVQAISTGNNFSSIGARAVMWRVAWKMFIDRPLFGAGQRAFSSEYKRYINEGRMFGQPHSDLFHAVSSGGVLKLFAYLGLLLAPWSFFYKRYKAARLQHTDSLMPILGMQVVAAYFLFGLTNSSLDLQIYSTTYAVLVCLLAKLTTNDKELAV